jgi:hypothetical protein
MDNPTGSRTERATAATTQIRPRTRPDRRPTARHRLIVALALAVLTGTAVALLPAPAPVAAADGCPGPVDHNGNCQVQNNLPVPPVTAPQPDPPPTPPDTSGNSDNDPPDDPYDCVWHRYPDQEFWRGVFPEAPPNSEFGEYHCSLDGVPLLGPYVPQFITPITGFGTAPGPEPPPSPAEVAAAAEVSVRALLLKPTVAVSPPAPVASTIGLPTFVSVPNWQGELTPPDHCLRGVCVSLRAEPALTFDPGEPGARSIACEDGGTVFDRHGADPDVQAAPPACAYTYTRRTGVAGRPAAWAAEVAVTWTVHWSAGGVDGTLDPITLSTTFDRTVRESVSVVTDYSR